MRRACRASPSPRVGAPPQDNLRVDSLFSLIVWCVCAAKTRLCVCNSLCMCVCHRNVWDQKPGAVQYAKKEPIRVLAESLRAYKVGLGRVLAAYYGTWGRVVQTGLAVRLRHTGAEESRSQSLCASSVRAQLLPNRTHTHDS